MKSIIIILSMILLYPGTILAGDFGMQKDFHAEILKTYGFQPHTLSHEQIEAKSKDL